jgi:hypothetical protein
MRNILKIYELDYCSIHSFHTGRASLPLPEVSYLYGACYDIMQGAGTLEVWKQWT